MDYVKVGQEELLNTYAQLPICFDKGEGCYLYDTDGNKYLDLVGGIAVNALGYKNEKLLKKLNDAASEGFFHVSNLYYNKYTVEAAKLINEVAGSDKVFFANSGAEANEGALKLARKYGSSKGKSKILSFEHSFHGRTYGAVTLTGQEKYHKGFYPMVPDIEYGIYNDLESVKQIVDDKFAAIFVEPIQGEGGIIPATKEFLEGLRKICDEKDMLLIYDCVQCGCGRTGYMFAWQYYGIKPDIMTLAKAVGGGLPLSALCAYSKASNVFSPGDHASTFGGNPISCALSTVVINELKSGLLDHVKDVGAYFKSKLNELVKLYPNICSEVRGFGLMLGLEVKITPKTIIDSARKKGVLMCSAGYDVVRFVPPLVITKGEVDETIKVLNSIFSQL